MHSMRSATCPGSICSEDKLRTSNLCPQEEMLTLKSYSPCRPPTRPSVDWPNHMSFDSLSFYNGDMVEHGANLH